MLKQGKPWNKYEQQADAVANQVMTMSEKDTLQMQPIEEEEELLHPKLRMQPIEEEKELLQPKLRMQPVIKEEEERVQLIEQGVSLFYPKLIPATTDNTRISKNGSSAIQLEEQPTTLQSDVTTNPPEASALIK